MVKLTVCLLSEEDELTCWICALAAAGAHKVASTVSAIASRARPLTIPFVITIYLPTTVEHVECQLRTGSRPGSNRGQTEV